MSEADASPTDEAARQDGSYLPARGALAVALALIGICGAAVLALVASKAAEPLVLTVLAVLATVGVFFLFALAAHQVHFGRPAQGAALARKIVEAIGEAVVVTDRAGRPLTANDAFRAFAGTNALGEPNTLDAALSLDPAGAEAMFRLSRAAERGHAAGEEVMLRGRDDGAPQWVKISVKPFKLSGRGGRAAAFLWRVSDITSERERQNDALSALESRLARYASLPLGLMAASADGHVTHMNARLGQWLGYPLSPNGEIGVRDLHLAELVADGGARLIATAGEAEDGPRRLDLDLISEDGRRWPATLIVGRQQNGSHSIAVFERPVDDAGARGMRG
ncbi:MAG: PAS domain-containing protein, partial [Hyphomicrobiaceae bacterium]